jgi:UDPglucose 6-dehydrogenase
MKVGFVGLGKLGLPVSLAIEEKGHNVLGYDISLEILDSINRKNWPFYEKGVPERLSKSSLKIVDSIVDIVKESDIVFCPVQTPHDPLYEGTTCLTPERIDFDYTYLLNAISSVAQEAQRQKKNTILAVISTCLPGTYEEKIKPLLNEYIEYVYTPQFIAMGQVIEDYLNPEFALIGVESEYAAKELELFYNSLFNKPHIVTDITTAEGIKVSYNTWITAKTVIANVWGEIAEKTNMNFDDIYKAWSVSTNRLISTKYMNSGVGDGGGCHPRDNIAMSHLAKKIDLSYDLFESLIIARQNHMEWLGNFASEISDKTGLNLIILGKSFKPETNIETGSPSILMANILKDKGYEINHFEDWPEKNIASVFIIGTKHEKYKNIIFPKGSYVIDPFRYIENQNGVTVIKIGEGKQND